MSYEIFPSRGAPQSDTISTSEPQRDREVLHRREQHLHCESTEVSLLPVLMYVHTSNIIRSLGNEAVDKVRELLCSVTKAPRVVSVKLLLFSSTTYPCLILLLDFSPREVRRIAPGHPKRRLLAVSNSPLPRVNLALYLCQSLLSLHLSENPKLTLVNRLKTG